MDYRGFRAGVTVYFPVFVPGALLFVGDGHATQGDGEIAGTGIEISFDVEFTVELLKGEQIGWPRGENDEYIFTAGNARPLDQALQHATTEMVRWLERDWRPRCGGGQHAARPVRGVRRWQCLRSRLHHDLQDAEAGAAPGGGGELIRRGRVALRLDASRH